MNPPDLIGLSGYATAGKDTVADVIVAKYGYEKMAFADLLRELATAIDPVIGDDRGRGSDGRGVRLLHLSDVKEFSYNSLKAMFPEYRRFLQRLGTEAGRNILGENFWVDAAMARRKPGVRYVVTDMRFLNEAEAVQQAGGVTVRIHRPGVGPANDHISEIGLDGWPFDAWLYNDGGFEDLHLSVDRLMGAISE